jgi:hypothetical protein
VQDKKVEGFFVLHPQTKISFRVIFLLPRQAMATILTHIRQGYLYKDGANGG